MTQAEKYFRRHRNSPYEPRLGSHGEQYESYAFVTYLTHKADERDEMVEDMTAWQKKLSNCYQAMWGCGYPPDILRAIKAVAEGMKVYTKGE